MFQQPAKGRAEQDLSQKTLASITLPMFLVDHNCVVTHINEPALTLTGYSRNEVVNQIKCHELHRALPLRTPDGCALGCCMENGMALEVDTEIVTRDGSDVSVHASHSPMFDEEGEFSGGVVTLFDRTEEARAREQLENVLRSVGAPLLVVDEELLVTRINDAALTMVGYSRDEVERKMTCAELCRTEGCGTENCNMRKTMRTGEVITRELTVTARDGMRMPVRAISSPLYDKNGSMAGGVEIFVRQGEAKAGETPPESSDLSDFSTDSKQTDARTIDDGITEF